MYATTATALQPPGPLLTHRVGKGRIQRRNKSASCLVRIVRDLSICFLMLFPYILMPVS